MNDDDVVAIARLRGRQLQTLDVPLCCISSVEPESEAHTVGLEYGCVRSDFSAEVGHTPQLWRHLPLPQLDSGDAV